MNWFSVITSAVASSVTESTCKRYPSPMSAIEPAATGDDRSPVRPSGVPETDFPDEGEFVVTGAPVVVERGPLPYGLRAVDGASVATAASEVA